MMVLVVNVLFIWEPNLTKSQAYLGKGCTRNEQKIKITLILLSIDHAPIATTPHAYISDMIDQAIETVVFTLTSARYLLSNNHLILQCMQGITKFWIGLLYLIIRHPLGGRTWQLYPQDITNRLKWVKMQIIFNSTHFIKSCKNHCSDKFISCGINFVTNDQTNQGILHII